MGRPARQKASQGEPLHGLLLRGALAAGPLPGMGLSRRYARSFSAIAVSRMVLACGPTQQEPERRSQPREVRAIAKWRRRNYSVALGERAKHAGDGRAAMVQPLLPELLATWRM